MSSSHSSTSGGIGFMGVLFIAFLVLKLCHVIDWSWWWITAPLWGPVTLLIAIIVLGCIIYGIVHIAKPRR